MHILRRLIRLITSPFFVPKSTFHCTLQFDFKFQCCVSGESGLGKSTLINSMFLSDIYSNEYPGPSHRVKKTVQVS